jgi:integrase
MPWRRHWRTGRRSASDLDRAEQIEALLDAAGELDKKARFNRGGRPRRALLATLALAGLRIGEALALRWRDVDLAAGRLHVGRAKTDAGVRSVDLLPALRDELAALKANSPGTASGDLVFPTATGNQQNPSNVRTRTLAKSIEGANERLAESGLAPVPEGLTPHSLRRTFASILFALGKELPYVMAQLGHTSPGMTLGIYARVMMDGEDERLALLRLVDGGSESDSQPKLEADTQPTV